MKSTAAENTYTQAVKRGDYDLYIGKLFGKYDNVRVYWEDQITRIVIRPFLHELVLNKRRKGEKLRILDLGCGTGQGYEILTRIDKYDLNLGLHHDRVLSEGNIEKYLGLDLSPTMVAKGNEIYEQKPHIHFIQADLRDGLSAIKEKEGPFDIYFSSYASFSHLTRDQLKFLIKDICNHGRDGSLAVLDLIGRYSVEWPCYWAARAEDEKVRDYSMSYLSPEAGSNAEVEHFPVRFWTGDEAEELVEEICSETGVKIDILKKFDRSIMVGRHVDTKEYNPHIKPIRRVVNRLHEDYMRTDLNELILDRKMFPKHPESCVSLFFENLLRSWNTLVRYCQQRLKKNISLVDLKGWPDFSPHLQFALITIDRVISSTEWMWYGDPRANIIEPQLGYALRSLEINLQKGVGCGHGLVVVIKIKK